MVEINTTKPKSEFEVCRSSCPYARFDSDGGIDCDPPMGQCLLEHDLHQKQLGAELNRPTPHAIRGQLHFTGKPKLYQMGYMQGYPHVELESYYGQGVIVSYLMTGVTFSWEWQYRNEAWDYARGKKLHIDEIKANGNRYAMGVS